MKAWEIGLAIGAAIGGILAIVVMLLAYGAMFALPFVGAYYVFRWLTGV